MRLINPTGRNRLNEAAGFLYLGLAVLVLLSLVSYHAEDASLNTATGEAPPHNLIGPVGSYFADFALQALGLPVFLLPVGLCLLGWKWIRSEAVSSPRLKLVGFVLLILSLCCGLSIGPTLAVFDGSIQVGGLVGLVLAEWLIRAFNVTGAVVVSIMALVLSTYLVTKFSVGQLGFLAGLLDVLLAPWRLVASFVSGLWQHLAQKRREKSERRREEAGAREQRQREGARPEGGRSHPHLWEGDNEAPDELGEIPIRTLDELPAEPRGAGLRGEFPAFEEPEDAFPATPVRPAPRHVQYRLPDTSLLNGPPVRCGYDSTELKELAGRIKAKFEEFAVTGSVVQINPGPVVTTFEFKPDAGVKLSRIVNLAEDLCLGLQAESILIERIPGKATVGIEVPNSRRELICLREMLESDEFAESAASLTVPLGKDISGRIRIASLEVMPHLLIAGSTGSGKSVMLNSLIMSVLYKATPEQVRMILVDPKRLEMGLYEGVPHLLTPVITEPKKAANALRNALLEMERRLRLLASQGVRNIDQFNRKVRQLRDKPMSLFENDPGEEVLEPLPFILIVIDELADLMMVERANVEEAVTRLAQMARAVGMHLVLATQRPSVDVITGLIKANFPARLSFRVATKVDSRTILDRMGAEHLLGRGDMLFLPPGQGRLVRVHGAFVTETEINRVVDFWKEQGTAEYDQSYLIAPPGAEDEDGEEFSGEQDPLYEDAVRIVVDMGKASTSILQRRLRLGYGRAARILDVMQREGIIGPPDGSRPREVLRSPDWLHEVDTELR
jgi:S-DNA-T family DNA segregation ATPase FtsK/SpoIIIE